MLQRNEIAEIHTQYTQKLFLEHVLHNNVQTYNGGGSPNDTNTVKVVRLKKRKQCLIYYRYDGIKYYWHTHAHRPTPVHMYTHTVTQALVHICTQLHKYTHNEKYRLYKLLLQCRKNNLLSTKNLNGLRANHK